MYLPNSCHIIIPTNAAVCVRPWLDVMLVPDHQGRSEASAPDPAPGPGINIVILDSS